MPSNARQLPGLPAATPCVFTIDEDTFTVPDLPARVWLDALVHAQPGCWWLIIPTQLTKPEQQRILQRLLDPTDPFDLDDLEHAAIATAAAVCGVDFWAATRLAVAAYSNWLLFDGWSYTRGVDPLSQPIGRVLAAVYAWRRTMCEKQSDVARLDAEIWTPPPALTAAGNPRDVAPPAWSDEREGASFMAALSNLGVA